MKRELKSRQKKKPVSAEIRSVLRVSTDTPFSTVCTEKEEREKKEKKHVFNQNLDRRKKLRNCVR